MRMPRLRFTVRRMMVAVAIAALAFAGIATASRLRRLSAAYSAQVTRCETGWMCVNSCYPTGHPARSHDREAVRKWKARFVRHWKVMAAKSEYAARYPWLPVEPNPPEPE